MKPGNPTLRWGNSAHLSGVGSQGSQWLVPVSAFTFKVLSNFFLAQVSLDRGWGPMYETGRNLLGTDID